MVSPIGHSEPGDLDEVTVTAPELSVAVGGDQVTVALGLPGSVLNEIDERQPENTGSSTSARCNDTIEFRNTKLARTGTY